MNLPLTERERTAAKRVDAIEDVVQECRRRWPGFSFSVERWDTLSAGEVLRVEARWSVGPHAYQLRDEIPRTSTRMQIEQSKRAIARHALLNDEMRKVPHG